MLLPFVALWGIPELITRLADPPLEQFQGIHFGGDRSSPLLFMKDPLLHWRLRPGADVEFLGVRVETDSHGFRGAGKLREDRRTVLCLGDSTPFGWELAGEDAFPSQLEAILNREAGQPGSWQVINAGVPGYSSFQVKQLALQLIPKWKPEYVVLLIGNNDAWPAERSDRERDPGPAKPLRSLLSHSRFLLWLAGKVSPEEPEPFVARSLIGAAPRVSGEEYVDEIAQVVSSARRHGAEVIVAEPTVNLYEAPKRVRLLEGREDLEKRWPEMTGLLGASRPDLALARAERALSRESHRFEFQWIRGMALTMMGETTWGAEVLEQTLEENPFPERCKLSYRQRLREYAVREGVTYLATNELFQSSMDYRVRRSFFLDYCHPTAAGHRLIAEHLAKLILVGA